MSKQNVYRGNRQRSRSLPPPDQFYFARDGARDDDVSSYKENDDKRERNNLLHKAARAKEAFAGCFQDGVAKFQHPNPGEPLVSGPRRSSGVRRSSSSYQQQQQLQRPSRSSWQPQNASAYNQFDPNIPTHVEYVVQPNDESHDAMKAIAKSKSFSTSTSTDEKAATDSISLKGGDSPVALLFADIAEEAEEEAEEYDRKFLPACAVSSAPHTTEQEKSNNHDAWLRAVLDVRRRSQIESRKSGSLESAVTGPLIPSRAEEKAVVVVDHGKTTEVDGMHRKTTLRSEGPYESPKMSNTANRESHGQFSESTSWTETTKENFRTQAKKESVESSTSLRKSIQDNVQRQIDAQLEIRRQSQSSNNDGRRSSASNDHTQQGHRRNSPEPRNDHRRSNEVTLQQVEKPQRPARRRSSQSVNHGRSDEPRPSQQQLVARRRSSHSQGTNRLERLRLQYHDELEKIAAAGPTRGRTVLRLSRSKASCGVPKRSSSLPPSPYKPVAAAKKNRRSSSVPPRRAELPILLQLAGWEVPPVPPQRQQLLPNNELPVLLKLAGWQEPPKDVRSQQPRLSTQPRLQGNGDIKKVRVKVQRMSDPVMRSTKRPSDVVKRVRVREGKTQLYHPKQLPVPREHRAVGRQEGPIDTDVAVKQELARKQRTRETREPVAAKYQDRPTKREPKSKAVSTAMILQQTMVLHKQILHDDGADYLTVANPVLALQSPALSLDDSHATGASERTMPLVSEEARANAAFLFTDEADRRTSLPFKSQKSFTISTLDARNRISGLSTRSDSITIPVGGISVNTSLGEPSKESSYRRVRFSDSDEKYSPVVADPKSPFREVRERPSNVSIPEIQPNLSDLTDVMEHMRDSLSTSDGRRSNSTAGSMRVEPIPEDPLLEQEEEEEEDNFADDEKTTDDTPPARTIIRWTSKGLGQGVTPFRAGSSSVTNTTESPRLRFNDARKKFSSSTGSEKHIPVKRSSPVKRKTLGVVHSRIVDFEALRKARSDSPRKTTMISPVFKQDPRPSESPRNQAVVPEVSPALTYIDGKEVKKAHETSAASASTSHSATHSDNFRSIDEDEKAPSSVRVTPGVKALVHADEDSDDEDDAFADIFNRPDDFSEDEDESEEDDDDDDATGSTIPAQYRAAQYGSYRMSSDSTASTMERQRLSFLSRDSVSTATGTAFLPYRDDAPVKPNEQKPRPTGTLVLSPMSRTPSQAMKWRSLAVAAQEKDKKKNKDKTLSERHPNVY